MYSVTVPVICHTAYLHREETLKCLKEAGANRVAIALYREMEYGGSSPETLKELGELLRFFEANRMETLVWLGETLGHDRVSPPSRKKPAHATHIRRLDLGEVAAFCPMDMRHADWIASWIQELIACGARTLLLDDDFRMGQGFGCCCDLHMAALAKRLGRAVSREELRERMLCGGRNEYRDAWLAVQGEGKLLFAERLRRSMDAVDPSVRLGACITMACWDTDGVDPIVLANVLAGNTKPLMRLFGAPYHLSALNEIEREPFLANVIEKERTQLTWCENSNVEVLVEGDTYPRPRFACPASHLECFDMILRADGRPNGIMKYMMDYVSSPSYERGYIDFAARNRDLCCEIEDLFSKGKTMGVRPYHSKNVIRDAVLDPHASDLLTRSEALMIDESSAYTLIAACSLPRTDEHGSVSIVFGEAGRHIPREELASGTILDLQAAELLTARGIDVGIEKVTYEAPDAREGFYVLPTEHELMRNEKIRLDPMFLPHVCVKPTARILSRLSEDGQTRDFVFQYENAEGERFLVLPFSAREARLRSGYFKSYVRRRMLVQAIEWLGGRPLDAYLEGNDPLLYLLVKREGDTLRVGIWNLFDDRADAVRVCVNLPIERVRYLHCNGHVEGNCVVLDSRLYPYEFAGLEINGSDFDRSFHF